MQFLRFLGISALILCGFAGCKTTEVESIEPTDFVDIVSPEHDGMVGDHHLVLREGVMFSLQVEAGGKLEVELESCRIREDGSAVLPIIGKTSLVGLGLAEATDRLTKAYSDYYIETPLVRIELLQDEQGLSAPWGFVTVMGRVKNPGRVPFPPTRDLTLSGAIQGAEGFDTSANLSVVRITRTLQDGTQKHIIVDMNKIGDEGYQDIPLRTGDLIKVPERIF